MSSVGATVEKGVNVRSRVRVAVGLSVAVGKRTTGALGSGVKRGMSVEADVGGKIWLATESPKKAEATVEESKTSASASHCQPASMWERRVR